MNYIIPMCDCLIFNQECFNLKSGVKYKTTNYVPSLVFGSNIIPFVFDLNQTSANVLTVQFCKDTYHFLFPTKYFAYFSTTIKHKNNQIEIQLSNKLYVSINSELKCEKDVENLKYSHYETKNDLCLIYFVGKRNFLIVIKNEEVVFASCYDECNEHEKEKYFMSRLNDSLNHGKVCYINDNEFSTYLVYLDNEELHLKSEFVPHVFLDCVLAENFKYCNQLLKVELRVENEKSIKDFFPNFDFFYALDKNIFVLINKNTLAGIFEFSVENNQISNIINLPNVCEHTQLS